VNHQLGFSLMQIIVMVSLNRVLPIPLSQLNGLLAGISISYKKARCREIGKLLMIERLHLKPDKKCPRQ
jgi:hypothetical protein